MPGSEFTSFLKRVITAIKRLFGLNGSRDKMVTGNMAPEISSSSLAWLADAPLFIDERQVGAFYDAVVMPQSSTGKTVLEVSKGTGFKLGGKVGGSLEVGPSDILKMWFPFLSAKATATAEGTGETSGDSHDKRTIELLPIDTAQRQLVQLALHYSANLQDRLQFVEQTDLPNPEWRHKDYIRSSPRALCFIELPGLEDASASTLTATKLIPLAAEFADNAVVLFFDRFRSENGRTMPPNYPKFDEKETETVRTDKRKEYWDWFDKNYDVGIATEMVEEAAKEHGRVRWIDFRLPLTPDGETLHLHLSPAEKYDIGSFAYNFIRRGYEHGLRIVGTLKSEPDVNVLAIFEK